MPGLEGRRLGGCVLVQSIGLGGTGEVYLADQHDRGRQVAVKVLRLVGDANGDAASAAQAGAQFIRAIRLIATLEHPDILPVFDGGEQDGLHYVMMAYMRDGSLASLLAPGPTHRLDLPLAPTVVVGLIAQVAAALQTAHDHQPPVIHGDLKPSNLLVRLVPVPPPPGMAGATAPGSAPAAFAQMQLLLADFGLAHTASDPNAPRPATAATPYTAPEQFAGPAVPASDQYALACVAYELLAGQHVFDGEPEALAQQHAFVAPLPPRQRNPTLPPAVDTMLLRALAKTPAQRYATVAEFMQAFGAALAPPPYAGPLSSPVAAGAPGNISRPIAGGMVMPPAMAGSRAGTLPPPPMAPGRSVTMPPPSIAPPAPSAPPSLPKRPIPRRRVLITGGIAAGVILLAAGGGGVYWFSRGHSPATGKGATKTPGATTHPGDTLGVYRPASGTFILQQSLSENSAFISLKFGKPDLLPITGDWDGDGVDTLGVYDPATLTFMLADKNEQGASITRRFQFGQVGDLPVAGDWAGTGSDGVGVYRPSTGQFILSNSLSGGGADFTMQLGQLHDLPVTGDWNGDGHDSIGVFRPSTQTFYLSDSVCDCAPVVAYSVVFGQAGDKPFAGDWTRSGRSGLGMFVPANSTMSLKHDATTSGPPDQNILFGSPSDIPVAGHWGLGS